MKILLIGNKQNIDKFDINLDDYDLVARVNKLSNFDNTKGKCDILWCECNSHFIYCYDTNLYNTKDYINYIKDNLKLVVAPMPHYNNLPKIFGDNYNFDTLKIDNNYEYIEDTTMCTSTIRLAFVLLKLYPNCQLNIVCFDKDRLNCNSSQYIHSYHTPQRDQKMIDLLINKYNVNFISY